MDNLWLFPVQRFVFNQIYRIACHTWWPGKGMECGRSLVPPALRDRFYRLTWHYIERGKDKSREKSRCRGRVVTSVEYLCGRASTRRRGVDAGLERGVKTTWMPTRDGDDRDQIEGLFSEVRKRRERGCIDHWTNGFSGFSLIGVWFIASPKSPFVG